MRTSGGGSVTYSFATATTDAAASTAAPDRLPARGVNDATLAPAPTSAPAPAAAAAAAAAPAPAAAASAASSPVNAAAAADQNTELTALKAELAALRFAEDKAEMAAGAYTCPLSSSTRALSDTKNTLNTPNIP
jgi:hypothetical protein